MRSNARWDPAQVVLPMAPILIQEGGVISLGLMWMKNRRAVTANDWASAVRRSQVPFTILAAGSGLESNKRELAR